MPYITPRLGGIARTAVVFLPPLSELAGNAGYLYTGVMAIQLMKLRHVPEDELLELQQLLDEHGIDYFETSAGNWGISMPALWLSNNEEFPRARALLDQYSQERYARMRAEYEALKQAGKARTFMDIFRENPLRTILYITIALALTYISIVPFVSLISF